MLSLLDRFLRNINGVYNIREHINIKITWCLVYYDYNIVGKCGKFRNTHRHTQTPTMAPTWKTFKHTVGKLHLPHCKPVGSMIKFPIIYWNGRCTNWFSQQHNWEIEEVWLTVVLFGFGVLRVLCICSVFVIFNGNLMKKLNIWLLSMECILFDCLYIWWCDLKTLALSDD